jgi:hypothetical protein
MTPVTLTMGAQYKNHVLLMAHHIVEGVLVKGVELLLTSEVTMQCNSVDLQP